jgi:hypothetical protein
VDLDRNPGDPNPDPGIRYWFERRPPAHDSSRPDEIPASPVLAALEPPLARAAKYLFFALVVTLSLYVSLTVFAQPAFAQAGGQIQGAIDNATDWLSGIMTSLGGLGMIASIGVKAVARTNENMHHAAHMGMTGSGIAIVAGLLIDDIIGLMESFAGGGGGGG